MTKMGFRIFYYPETDKLESLLVVLFFASLGSLWANKTAEQIRRGFLCIFFNC